MPFGSAPYRFLQLAARGFQFPLLTFVKVQRRYARKQVSSRKNVSLNWSGPFKNIGVDLTLASDTPDGRYLLNKLVYLAVSSGIMCPERTPTAASLSFDVL